MFNHRLNWPDKKQWNSFVRTTRGWINLVFCCYRTMFIIPVTYSTLGWIKVFLFVNNRKVTYNSTTGCDTNAFGYSKCTYMIQIRYVQCAILTQVDLLQMFNYGLPNPPPQTHNSTYGWIVWGLSCNKLVLIEKLSNLSNISVMLRLPIIEARPISSGREYVDLSYLYPKINQMPVLSTYNSTCGWNRVYICRTNR